MRHRDRPRPRRAVVHLALLLVLALAVGACSDDGGDGDAGAGSTTSSTPPPAADPAALPPCEVPPGPEPVEPQGSSAEGASLIGVATVEPGPNSVLSGVLTVETASPAVVSAVATAGELSVEVPASTSATRHELALLGLRAETTYDVAVTAVAADGTEESVALTFATGSVPEHLPDLDATVSEPAAMAPGVTIFNIRVWGPGDSATCQPPTPDVAGWILGVDAEGELVWYYRTELEVTDVSPTGRGTLLVSVHDVIIREIDLLGRTVRELGTRVATEYSPVDFAGNAYVGPDTVPIDIDSAHHELYERPDGNLITISTEVVELDAAAFEGRCDGAVDLDGNPISDPTAVISDVVVELTPEGEVVQEWPMIDYFDPELRPGAEMCARPNPIAPPNWFYPDRGDLRDWTHANAAVVDDATNTLLVSLRHLDSVLGIRYRDDASGPAGELLWDLSPDGTLALVSGEHSRHGHAVEPQADGTILYYDNGNRRPGTIPEGGEEPPYSRAVVYRIDGAAGTAEQLWAHRDVTPEGVPVFARFLSDADRLANGDVLITHGGVATDDNVLYSRIVEVVPGGDGSGDRIVFDLTVGDRRTLGFTSYRAERLPSLYLEAGPPAGG